jgi:hypothetical protein
MPLHLNILQSKQSGNKVKTYHTGGVLEFAVISTKISLGLDKRSGLDILTYPCAMYVRLGFDKQF